MQTGEHSLTLGDLHLIGSLPDVMHQYVYEVMAEGTSFGSSDPVTSVVQTMLADGDLVRMDRFGNREVPLRVRITGPTLDAVAHGEKALRRELGRPNLLVWQPPDVLAVPTCWEVAWSWFDPAFDDLEELRRSRTFAVTLWCKPHARAAEPVEIPALPRPSLAPVVIDECDSAAGWAGMRGARATTPGEGPSTDWEAGAVGIAELDDEVTAPERWTLTRAGVVDFSQRPYLVAQVRTLASDSGQPLRLVAAVSNGQWVLPLSAVRMADDPRYFQVTFSMVGRGTVDSVGFMHYSRAGDVWQGLFIRRVEQHDAPPSPPRQVLRVVENLGTERTPVSLKVESTGDPLGTTIVHTSPATGTGYSPQLRRWRTTASTGPVEAAGATFTGFEEPIAHASGGFVAEVPVGSLPAGGYVLMAGLRYGNAAGGQTTIHWSTSTILPGSLAQHGYVNGSTPVAFPDGNWACTPLAVLSLPSLRTTDGAVQVVLQATTAAQQVYLDDAWLLRADDDCALTLVELGTATTLWLDSAGEGASVPTVWINSGAAGRHHPGASLAAPGSHMLHEGGTEVFVATRGAMADVSGRYYPTYAHNVPSRESS